MTQGGLRIRIAIVTDGGKEKGMGHVMRAMTLAREVRDYTEVSFITASDKSVQDLISSNNFNVEFVPNDQELVELVISKSLDTVIFDRLYLEENLTKSIREKSQVMISVLDNDTAANNWADIVVNALLNPSFQNNHYVNEATGTHYYYGPKYLLLKEEFTKYSKEMIVPPEEAQKFLLIFGGSDPANLTNKTLHGLLSLEIQDPEIVTIMGPEFAYSEDVDKTIQSFNAQGEVRKIQNSDRVADLMLWSDIVFTSPGLSFFEALSIGLPVIVAAQNELQRTVYDVFFQEYQNVPEIFRFFEESYFLLPSQRKVKEMEIGKGRAEIIDALIRPR